MVAMQKEAAKKGLERKEVGCGCKPATYIQQIDPQPFSLATYFHYLVFSSSPADFDF